MSSSRNGQVRVVVVDDEEVFRAVGRSLIEATPEFVLVGEADSGERGLERIAELSPDLVLMDYRMGALDGITAARVVAERHPGITVIVMSADGLDDALLNGSATMCFVRKQDLSPTRLRETWANRR